MYTTSRHVYCGATSFAAQHISATNRTTSRHQTAYLPRDLIRRAKHVHHESAQTTYVPRTSVSAQHFLDVGQYTGCSYFFAGAGTLDDQRLVVVAACANLDQIVGACQLANG